MTWYATPTRGTPGRGPGWHGTNDDILRYPNFGEQVEQWTNVHGLSQTPVFTDSPKAGYTRTRYGGTGGAAPVEAISLQGRGHGLPDEAAETIRFFGLDATPPTTPPPTTAQQIVGAQSGRCLTVPGTGTILLPAERRKPHTDLAVGRPGVRS